MCLLLTVLIIHNPLCLTMTVTGKIPCDGNTKNLTNPGTWNAQDHYQINARIEEQWELAKYMIKEYRLIERKARKTINLNRCTFQCCTQIL